MTSKPRDGVHGWFDRLDDQKWLTNLPPEPPVNEPEARRQWKLDNGICLGCSHRLPEHGGGCPAGSNPGRLD